MIGVLRTKQTNKQTKTKNKAILGFAGTKLKWFQVAEAAFNPTPGLRLGIDQDSYEAKGNGWIRWSSSPNITLNIVLKKLGLMKIPAKRAESIR